MTEMGRYERFTEEVAASTTGPQIGAFFDYDRTLISEFSAESFFREVVREGIADPLDIARALVMIIAYLMGWQPFPSLLRMSADVVSGEQSADLEALGARLFEKRIAGEIYPEARAVLEAHRKKGHTTVLVSSATRYQVQDAAGDLGFDHVICNDYEVSDGRFTGNLIEPIMYGVGKLHAAEELAAREDLNLDCSWFYTDGYEDLPLLEEVGNPRPTNPDRALRRSAKRRGWSILDFATRGRPALSELVRTGGVAASLAISAAVGIPLGWANGSYREGLNLATALFGDIGMAVAGIDLHVEGEEHLWEARPAVFIFNHQSGVDMLVLAKLLRENVTGVAKAELKHTPVLGPLFSYAGVAFVHRFDHTRAMRELAPAIEALRNGVSLIIAPEGTRSVTPMVGPFKKGAFHIAMQAGVPVVPIVLCNTLDVLPKGRILLHPAPVDVTVLPPVPTDDWTHDTMDAHIAEIHAQFEKVLLR